jgi:predicted metal-binding membrane protein
MSGEIIVPGGWTLSMAWIRMCGQPWSAAAAAFLGMWVAMTLAMMLPAFAPSLWRYRRAVAGAAGPTATEGGERPSAPTLIAGTVYFLVWTATGAVVYPIGLASAALSTRSPELARAVPLAIAVALLLIGALQFTAWKARRLARCRDFRGCGSAARIGAAGALRAGLQMGLDCIGCCGSLMSIVLLVGIMDLRAMAVVSAAIALERVAPNARLAAQAIGLASLSVGTLRLAQAVLA